MRRRLLWLIESGSLDLLLSSGLLSAGLVLGLTGSITSGAFLMFFGFAWSQL